MAAVGAVSYHEFYPVPILRIRLSSHEKGRFAAAVGSSSSRDVAQGEFAPIADEEYLTQRQDDAEPRSRFSAKHGYRAV